MECCLLTSADSQGPDGDLLYPSEIPGFLAGADMGLNFEVDRIYLNDPLSYKVVS